MKCVYTLLLNQSFNRVVTYILVYIYYLYLLALFSNVKEEKEWFSLLSTHVRRTTFQTKTNVSPVLVFLWRKWFAYNNLVLCTYNSTYICTSSVDVQLCIRKYSPLGKHRERLLYVRESDPATNWRHSGVTYFLATLSRTLRTKFEFS